MTNIVVNTDRCAGIGMCEMTAPQVFEVGADGLSHVLQQDPTGTDLTAAREAVGNCPTAALSMENS